MFLIRLPPVPVYGVSLYRFPPSPLLGLVALCVFLFGPQVLRSCPSSTLGLVLSVSFLVLATAENKLFPWLVGPCICLFSVSFSGIGPSSFIWLNYFFSHADVGRGS